MRLKVWVEVFTREILTEDVFEIPDEEWSAMTVEEREAKKQAIFDAYLVNIANGGCEEVEG